MAWVNLETDILEEFASHTNTVHSEEWDWWCNHDERARCSLESELLKLEDIEEQGRQIFLSPERLNGLNVYERGRQWREYDAWVHEKCEERRQKLAKKVNTNARASAVHWSRIKSDPQKLSHRNWSKRMARWVKRHEGQEEFI